MMMIPVMTELQLWIAIVLLPQLSRRCCANGKTDPKGTKATLHQIAAGLQSAAEGYLTLASHMSKVAP